MLDMFKQMLIEYHNHDQQPKWDGRVTDHSLPLTQKLSAGLKLTMGTNVLLTFYQATNAFIDITTDSTEIEKLINSKHRHNTTKIVQVTVAGIPIPKQFQQALPDGTQLSYQFISNTHVKIAASITNEQVQQCFEQFKYRFQLKDLYNYWDDIIHHSYVELNEFNDADDLNLEYGRDPHAMDDYYAVKQNGTYHLVRIIYGPEGQEELDRAYDPAFQSLSKQNNIGRDIFNMFIIIAQRQKKRENGQIPNCTQQEISEIALNKSRYGKLQVECYTCATPFYTDAQECHRIMLHFLDLVDKDGCDIYFAITKLDSLY